MQYCGGSWHWSVCEKIPHVQGQRETPQPYGRRGKITFRIKPHTRQRCLRGLKQTLCTSGPRDTTETETELCLSVSCRGASQQWTAGGAGALDAADLGIS